MEDKISKVKKKKKKIIKMNMREKFNFCEI